jgi:hypothetical protein
MARKKKTALPSVNTMPPAHQMRICWITTKYGEVVLSTIGMGAAHFDSAESCAAWLRDTADQVERRSKQHLPVTSEK